MRFCYLFVCGKTRNDALMFESLILLNLMANAFDSTHYMFNVLDSAHSYGQRI